MHALSPWNDRYFIELNSKFLLLCFDCRLALGRNQQGSLPINIS